MLCKRIASVLTAAGMALGLLTCPQASAAETPLRVMPLGDSITDGFTVTGGYRIPLWYMLQDKGIVEGIDFVGPNGWYIDGVADYNHAGYSGYTIADCPGRSGIYNFIDWLMEEYPADVVMLQIGTNDIISSYDLDHAGERLELLVDSILTYLPEDGMLYVSTIPYMDADVTTYTDAYTAEEMDAAVDAYNAQVREVVRKKQAEGKPIAQADVNAVLTKADLSDGVHPSEDGYRKMAEYWCGVLSDFIGGTSLPTQPPADLPTEPPTAPTTEPDGRHAVAMGNVYLDNTVDVRDIIQMQRFLLGVTDEIYASDISYPTYLITNTPWDLNGDGTLDIFDLGYLKRLVLYST